MIVLAIFLIGIGLAMILKTEWVWSLTERWKSPDATEPSGLYRVSIRVGGAICVLVGLANLAVYWIK